MTLDARYRRCSSPMKGPLMLNPDPARGRGKWITFALLLALAVFLYAGVIIIKVISPGF